MTKQKLIIIGLNWLGDIIMSVPALKSAAQFGELHIVTRPHLADVYELLGISAVIHKIDTKSSFINVFHETKQLRMLHPQCVIAFPDSLRAAAIAFMCKAKKRIGFKSQCRSFLLTDAISKPENYKSIHESRLYSILTQAAGCPHPDFDLSAPTFSNSVFEKAALSCGLNPKKKYVILAPGAAFGAAKRWPPKKFAEAAKLIRSQYPEIQILITAGKTELEIADLIIKNVAADFSAKGVINGAGKTTLKDLAALLSKASLLIANDSGTMHLAALYSTPTVVPVGPTDMVRTGALNPNFTPVISKTCKRAPCRQRVCPIKTHLCMESIDAQTIVNCAKPYLQ